MKEIISVINLGTTENGMDEKNSQELEMIEHIPLGQRQKLYFIGLIMKHLLMQS